MQAMPVIQASVRSPAAAFAIVIDGPTLPADATMKFGNIDVASRNVSSTVMQRKGRRDLMLSISTTDPGLNRRKKC